MPCSGPILDEKLVDQAYEEVFSLLREKYNIQKYPLVFTYMGNSREQTKINLKKAIRDLFMAQCNEDF